MVPGCSCCPCWHQDGAADPACAAVVRSSLPTLPSPALDTAQENTAEIPKTKTPVDANAAAGPTAKARKLAGASRAAAEEANNSAQGTERAQELRKQLAECRADTAEALKELAASRETLEKLEAARRRAQQRAAAAGQQAPTSHHNHGD